MFKAMAERSCSGVATVPSKRKKNEINKKERMRNENTVLLVPSIIYFCLSNCVFVLRSLGPNSIELS